MMLKATAENAEYIIFEEVEQKVVIYDVMVVRFYLSSIN